MTANTEKARSIWEELETGLGSGATFRVLLHMILNPQESFTCYGLVKATGLRTPAVTDQLNTLIELQWAKEDVRTPFSTARYQIDLENEVVRNILEFVWSLREIARKNRLPN